MRSRKNRRFKPKQIQHDYRNKLPLNKTIEIPSMIVVARAAFHKYYSHFFLDESLYKL